MRKQPKTDRSAVMRLAWRDWRTCIRRGWHLPGDDQWTFARCLRMAWAIEKQRLVFSQQRLALVA